MPASNPPFFFEATSGGGSGGTASLQSIGGLPSVEASSLSAPRSPGRLHLDAEISHCGL